MKNKTIISISIATMISCPAFATGSGISASDTTADCDNSTLGTYEGSTNLQAQWNANTINLDFYDGEDKISSGQCTYDGAIELPEDPIKTGYEFDGWKVRRASASPSQPQQTTFDLSTLFGPNDICTDGTGVGYTRLNGKAGVNEETYGLTRGSGEWVAEFSYGKIKGQALCSSTNGTWTQTGTPDETGTGDTRYCWCRPTGFAEPNSNSYQNVSSSSWVFDRDLDGADGCANGCANDCAFYVYNYDGFRRAVFGVTGTDMCPQYGGGSND